MRTRFSAVFLNLVPIVLMAAPAAAAADGHVVASIDLAGPFGTRSPWRFTARQGADIPDPIMGGDEKVPGAIALCLSKDGGLTCQPDLAHALVYKDANDIYAQAHFLSDARIVRPRPDRPLLLVRVASLQSVNGNQRIATMLLGYDRAADAFAPVYAHQTGHNNNEEVRYIADGPLAGALVSAEPTMDAPFAFWITVSRLGPKGAYTSVLRYRSATRYGDGNPLAVIDSDMPNIQQRLGLRHPGKPLPLPPKGCAKPHLIGEELWCA